MLRLQNDEIIYNNSESLGKCENLSFIDGGFSIILPDGSIMFIPEEGATPNEREVFAAYHEYYKDTGGIKPPADVSIEQIKATKIAELSEECYKRTIAGIDFTWENETKHYSLEVGDQVKLMSVYSEVIAGKQTVSWHADGEECAIWNADKFVAFFNQATYFIKMNELTFNSGLRPQIYRYTSANEVNQITWNSQFDEDIQSNLDTLISIIG